MTFWTGKFYIILLIKKNYFVISLIYFYLPLKEKLFFNLTVYPGKIVPALPEHDATSINIKWAIHKLNILLGRMENKFPYHFLCYTNVPLRFTHFL